LLDPGIRLADAPRERLPDAVVVLCFKGHRGRTVSRHDARDPVGPAVRLELEVEPRLFRERANELPQIIAQLGRTAVESDRHGLQE
jgi:hypothetical protein